MSLKYAFIDEFGAFGFNFEEQGCSSHFIITAIIVEEKDLPIIEEKIETIRQHYFQKGEIKSSKVARNHSRRIAILKDLKELPFKIFSLVCDKRKIYENSGLRFKEPFYKFLNQLAHQNLRLAFNKLVICADEVGGNDFIQSFAKYIKSKEEPLDLFGECSFRFEDSKKSVLIQVADFISGTLAYCYDEKKKLDSDGKNYQSMFIDRILRIIEYPETFKSFDVYKNYIGPDYNPKIAEICYNKAKYFIITHSNSNDIDIKQQIAILNYLLFRFMNKSPRKYIPTKELINQLVYLGYDKLSMQAFRNKIIARLRDCEVIISSSKSGYKIPSTETELYDFVNHGKSIIMPMLLRLKKCNDIIRMGTNGEINLFEQAEYQSIANLLNNK